MKHWKFAALLAVASCDKPAVVGRVAIAPLEEIAEVSGADVAALLRGSFERAGFQIVGEGMVVDLSMDARVDVDKQSPQTRKMLWVHLGVRPRGRDNGFSVARRGELHDEGGASGEFTTVLGRCLDQAASEAAKTIALRQAMGFRVRRALKSKIPAERAAALRVLVERKDPAALEPLLNLLSSEDLDAYQRAVGALAELGEVAAVNPIVQSASRRGPLVERGVLYAIASLGGDDALAYLDFSATGAADPGVRQAAVEALAELKANRRGAKEKR